MLQHTVREFAESEVKPLAREIDETGHFPRETFRKAAELGLPRVALPEAEGGAGFDHVSYSIVIEEISRVCASTGVILSVQNSLYCDPLHRFGTADQKKKFLAPSRAAKNIGCYALTEPQAGSNAAALAPPRCAGATAISSTAPRPGSPTAASPMPRWSTSIPTRRRGRKASPRCSSNAARPASMWARKKRKSASTPRPAPNFRSPIAKCPSKIASETKAKATRLLSSTLDGGRIGIAAQATGIAQGAFEQALAYAQRAPGLRPSHRRFPGHSVHAGGHGHRNRRGAPAGAQGRLEAGQRRAAFPWRLPSPSSSPRKWPRA